MYLIAALPLTCWLCALIAIPRSPRVGAEWVVHRMSPPSRLQYRGSYRGICRTQAARAIGTRRVPRRIHPTAQRNAALPRDKRRSRRGV